MREKMEIVFRKILHVLEFIIALLTLFVIVGMLAMEVYKMFTVPDYFATLDNYLHNILTIVVGLEFVRMLIDLTPANTLEVLIVAIARHPWQKPQQTTQQILSVRHSPDLHTPTNPASRSHLPGECRECQCSRFLLPLQTQLLYHGSPKMLSNYANHQQSPDIHMQHRPGQDHSGRQHNPGTA